MGGLGTLRTGVISCDKEDAPDKTLHRCPAERIGTGIDAHVLYDDRCPFPGQGVAKRIFKSGFLVYDHLGPGERAELRYREARNRVPPVGTGTDRFSRASTPFIRPSPGTRSHPAQFVHIVRAPKGSSPAAAIARACMV